MEAAEQEHATYRRIAVPLDGTAESEHALRWAITIAQRAQCMIDLVHVIVRPPSVSALYGAPAQAARAVEEQRPAPLQRLSRLASEIAEHGVRVEVSLIEGEVPASLEVHFQTTGADLIVIARHDKPWFEQLLFGSVAASVSRRAHIPVLIVRATQGEALFNPSVKIGRILLPFDGSAFAEQIIPHTATLALLMQAEITVLGILEPVTAMAAGALDAGPDPAVPLSNEPNDEHPGEPNLPALEAAATTLRSRGLTVRTVILAAGRPAHTIIRYAEEGALDLIALTTHARGALERALTGSVSAAVLRNARLPILIYRPKAS